MDAFSINGKGYLLIADVGDNFARRQSVSFLVVEEPGLEADQEQPLPVAWQVEFSYPDGPRDSEAVAVDPATERVLILSKRTFPNELYWVPLRVSENTRVVAEKIADLYPLPRNVPGNVALYGRAAPYQGMPTGMSLKANRLLVTTYRDAYLYDYDDVTQEPSRIPLPLVGQREAIAFARDADSTAYVSRERKTRRKSLRFLSLTLVLQRLSKGARGRCESLFNQFCGGSWRINAGIHLQVIGQTMLVDLFEMGCCGSRKTPRPLGFTGLNHFQATAHTDKPSVGWIEYLNIVI